MSKYAPLATYLRESGRETLSMSFAEIERIIGADLPPSAFKHRPWWSNNPSNSVITYAWLEAGYLTEQVDMAGQTLVFRKSSHDASPPEGGGVEAQDEAPAPAAAGADSFSLVFGALKGTVTVKEGTDLTAPVEADWEARG